MKRIEERNDKPPIFNIHKIKPSGKIRISLFFKEKITHTNLNSIAIYIIMYYGTAFAAIFACKCLIIF